MISINFLFKVTILAFKEQFPQNFMFKVTSLANFDIKSGFEVTTYHMHISVCVSVCQCHSTCVCLYVCMY